MVNKCQLQICFHLKTKGRSTVPTSEGIIAKTAQQLDLKLNKAHNDDRISIPILEICDNSYYQPLALIFNKYFSRSKFSSEWRKIAYFQLREKKRSNV